MTWVYDTVAQYGLSEAAVEQFLTEKFGNHSFHIEASIQVGM